MSEKNFKRHAVAQWSGPIKEGGGTLTTDSQVLNFTPYGFSSRFENKKGTNPEELIAAAHAGCFTMALANELQKQQITPQEIETRASVSLQSSGESWSIAEVHLEVWANANGDDEKIRAAAETAKENCPVSKVLNAHITMTLNTKEKRASISA